MVFDGLKEIWATYSNRRLLIATIPVLTLGIMGSALFPLPSAFQTTGILCAFFIMVIVAAATVYTAELLMNQSLATNQHDYETLAYAVGGRWWKFLTELSIVVLLVGTMVGGIVQCGEIFQAAAQAYAPDTVPDWINTVTGPRVLMTLTTILIFPVCMVEVMTQLEYVSIVGFVFVLMMLFTIVIQACINGLPGYYSGDLAPIGFDSLSNFASAVSTIAFAFYIQPIAMPMLREMPPGRVGYNILAYSMRIVIMGISFVIYAIIGFFGAARWGASTSSNLLQNVWGPGGYQGTLNVLLGIYLALTLPPILYPIAHVLKDWLPYGTKKDYGIMRRLLIVSLILIVCLAISLGVPDQSGKIVTVTGAAGVFLSCYLVPIVNHFMLFFGLAACQRPGKPLYYTRDADEVSYHKEGDPVGNGTPAAAEAGKMADPADPVADPGKGGDLPRPPSTGDVRHYRARVGLPLSIKEVSVDIVLPFIVVVFGAFCSALALKAMVSP